MKPWIIVFETLIIYITLPLLILTKVLPSAAVMPLLWLAFVYAFFMLRNMKHVHLLFHIDFKELLHVLKRFLIVAPLIVIYVFYFYPEMLFSFVKQNPYSWLMVMVLYPLLSAFTQEVVFRTFFTYRFENIIPDKRIFILVNALAFSYIHFVFNNMTAVIFTFFGSIFFMHTYLKSRSILLSSIEHSLYGNLMFTIGIGQFFYHGS